MTYRFALMQRTYGAFNLLQLIFCSIVFIARAELNKKYWVKVNPAGKTAAVCLA